MTCTATAKLLHAVKNVLPPSTDIQITVASEKELYRARFWQGFQNSVESDSAVGRGKVKYPFADKRQAKTPAVCLTPSFL